MHALTLAQRLVLSVEYGCYHLGVIVVKTSADTDKGFFERRALCTGGPISFSGYLFYILFSERASERENKEVIRDYVLLQVGFVSLGLIVNLLYVFLNYI